MIESHHRFMIAVQHLFIYLRFFPQSDNFESTSQQDPLFPSMPPVSGKPTVWSVSQSPPGVCYHLLSSQQLVRDAARIFYI